jgi:sulfur carrier protein
MVFKRYPQDFCCQFSAVKIAFRQIHQRICNMPGGYGKSFRDRFAFNQIGGHASTGNRGSTSIRPKSGIVYNIISNPKPNFHAFTACAAGCPKAIRIRQTIGIMRMDYMVDGDFGIVMTQLLSQIDFHFVHATIIKANDKSTDYLICFYCGAYDDGPMNSMKLKINGEIREISAVSNVRELLKVLEISESRVAVEINQRIIRRADWESARIADLDKVEIVQFVGGG